LDGRKPPSTPNELLDLQIYKRNEDMIKVGLFGIGLDTYWPQFDGLLENLKGYQEQIRTRIEDYNVEVINAGMIDNPAKAREAANFLKSQDVEIVFLYVSYSEMSDRLLHSHPGA